MIPQKTKKQKRENGPLGGTPIKEQKKGRIPKQARSVKIPPETLDKIRLYQLPKEFLMGAIERAIDAYLAIPEEVKREFLKGGE